MLIKENKHQMLPIAALPLGATIWGIVWDKYLELGPPLNWLSLLKP